MTIRARINLYSNHPPDCGGTTGFVEVDSISSNARGAATKNGCDLAGGASVGFGTSYAGVDDPLYVPALYQANYEMTYYPPVGYTQAYTATVQYKVRPRLMGGEGEGGESSRSRGARGARLAPRGGAIWRWTAPRLPAANWRGELPTTHTLYGFIPWRLPPTAFPQLKRLSDPESVATFTCNGEPHLEWQAGAAGAALIASLATARLARLLPGAGERRCACTCGRSVRGSRRFAACHTALHRLLTRRGWRCSITPHAAPSHTPPPWALPKQCRRRRPRTGKGRLPPTRARKARSAGRPLSAPATRARLHYWTKGRGCAEWWAGTCGS